MQSQSQDFHALTRVKRKRGERSGRSHRAAADPVSVATGHARSMTSFIQSALGSEAGDVEGREAGEDEGGVSRYTSTGCVPGGKAAGRGGRREQGTTAKRKPRRGGRAKRGRMAAATAAVRWPGFEEEGEGESSSSDIQTYSDSDEGDLHDDDTEDAPSQSDDIQDYLDQTTESVGNTMKWSEPRQAVRQRRKGHGSGRTVGQWPVTTSTPCHRKEPTDCLTERIDDFESPSSEDDAAYRSHPPSPPSQSSPLHFHPFTVAMTTRTTAQKTNPLIGRGLPASPIECASTPEDMRIATPPSSPEVLTSVSDFNRTKPSEWIKQVQLESSESNRGDLNDTMKTPHQHQRSYQCQSESSKRGGKGRKFIAGGLAERLQRVARCEDSEAMVWEHRAKKLEEKDSDADGCVTVHILSLANSHFLFIARCRVLKGSPLPQACTQTGRHALKQERVDDTQDSTQFSTQSPPHGDANGRSFHCSRLHDLRVGSDGVLDSASMHHGMETQSLEENRFNSASSRGIQSGMQPGGEDGIRTAQGLLALGECGEFVETASVNVTNETNSCKDEEVTVLFSLRSAGFLGLCAGSCVRIHPPWQCLSVPNSCHHHVLLCTNFYQSLGHVPLPRPPTILAPTSPLPPCRQKGVEGVYGLVSPEKVRNSPHSLLIKSPVKALQPMRLFSGQKDADETLMRAHHMVHETTTHLHSDSITMVTAAPTDGKNIGELSAATRSFIQGRYQEIKPCTLAEAMEHAHCGLVSFTAKVCRVYRRELPQRQEGDELNPPLRSLRQSFLQHAKLQPARPQVVCMRWVLLVCDSSRVFSEVQVIEETQPPWCDLVRFGEERAFHFINVRVAHRANPSKTPGLFSLLSSLRLGPAGSSQESSQTPLGPPPSGPTPTFCYTLLCQSDSKAVPYPSGGQLPPVMACPGREEQPQAQSPLTTARSAAGDGELAHRSSILARVVHLQCEVAQETDDEGHFSLQEPRPLYGHFLFVITSADAALSDGNRCQATIRVYLKPSFNFSDLGWVLSTPGSRVLLRDVLCEGDTEKHYSMDTCSMVIPVRAEDLGPGLDPYPEKSFTPEELQFLDTLSYPLLPPLNQDTATEGGLVGVTGTVVGVAEDQAYSWSACNTCGNSKLVSLDDSESSELYCDDCEKTVLSPSIHMQLTVLMQCPLLTSHTVSVQLLQSTIRELLPVSGASIEDGFDIHCVLNRAVSLNACYVTAARETPDGTPLLCLQEVDIEFRN